MKNAILLSFLFPAALLIAASAAADPVELEVESANPNVTLNVITEQATATAGTVTAHAQAWKMVCVVPCKQTVDRNAQYFIDGAGVTTSSKFVPPAAAHTKLHVDTGNNSVRMGGITLTVFGGIGAMTGGALLAFLPGKAIGPVFTGIGVAMLVPGIIMIATSGTTVTTDSGFVLASKKSPIGKVTLTNRGFVF